MSQPETFPSAAQEILVVEQVRARRQAGAEVLNELGVGYEVAGIILKGPRPECNGGTIADIVGMDSHVGIKDSIIRVAQEAKANNRDPGQAVSEAISIFAQRDESGNVMRVDKEQLITVENPQSEPKTPTKPIEAKVVDKTRQEAAAVQRDTIGLNKISNQQVEIRTGVNLEPAEVIRINSESMLRQEEIDRHLTEPEIQATKAEPDVIPAISEDEIQSLSVWLNEVESTQVYDRLNNHEILFTEQTIDSEEPAIVNSQYVLETTDTSYRLDEVEAYLDVSEGEVASLIEPQQQTQVEEGVVHVEDLDIFIEKEELINEIEASFETTEQEILGELLINIFKADVYDTYQADGNVDPSVNTVEEDSDSMNLGIENNQNALEKITELLEKYEPDVKGRATELISSISEITEELKSAESPSEQLLTELEETIHELFTTLGIELDDEQAHKFVDLLLLTLDKKISAPKNYNIDYLNRMGTREYKPLLRSMLGDLVQTANNQLNLLNIIGRYTIQVLQGHHKYLAEKE